MARRKGDLDKHLDRFGNEFTVGDYVVYPIGSSYAELQVGRVVELQTYEKWSWHPKGTQPHAKLVVGIVTKDRYPSDAWIVKKVHVRRIDRVARYPREYINAETLGRLEGAQG